MQSCKAGLEDRLNVKEAQETLKRLDKQSASLRGNLVTELRF